MTDMKETKEKKRMLAARIPQDILENLNVVSQKTGIPTSTIVARCLDSQKVLDVVKTHLESSLLSLDAKE
jgi:hypothetical protein